MQPEKAVDQIDLLSRIQFEVVDTPTGGGRAGKNLGIGPDGLMRIEINADSFLKYYRMDTNGADKNGYGGTSYKGLQYLFGHEWAHKTDAGQAVGADLWAKYLARPDVKALPNDTEHLKQYRDDDPEFVLNEAWTNTYADILLGYFNLEGIPNPTNGYLPGYARSR